MKVNLFFLVIFVISQLDVVFLSNLSPPDHPPKEDLMHRCCNITAHHHVKMHQLMKECKEELGEGETDGGDSLCVSECIGKKLGVVSFILLILIALNDEKLNSIKLPRSLHKLIHFHL